MDNLIVTFTNLYALRAIAISSSRIDTFLLCGAMMSSIVYHMLENTKHNMTGIPRLKHYEFMALNFDRMFAALVVARFLYTYFEKLDTRILTIGLSSIMCMMISECQHVVSLDAYPVRYTKAFYMLTHCLWHIGAFHTAYVIISKKVK